MRPILDCRDLYRRRGDRTVVAGLSLRIHAGSVYGLLGPNGAGKTTTISMIAGLLEPTSGQARVNGIRIRPGSTRGRDQLGLVPQELALFPDRSVTANLRFFGRLHGLSGARLRERTEAVLGLVELSDHGSSTVSTLSGGMQRRLNIAVGLLAMPALLILDEPTVGVDPQSREAILDGVKDLAGRGMAVLFASHHMAEVERICDVVGILDHGRLVAEGSPRMLIATHGGGDRLVLGLSGHAGALAEAIRAGVAEVKVQVRSAEDGTDVLELLTTDAASALPGVLAQAERVGARVLAVELSAPTLESVFFRLTGRGLRDGP